ncbi:DUF1800 family protein [Rhizobacter sp. OV335]|uniref:DUF1800 domain-containing protein n=1 Tax=Rhizobacter sp. OV335 TaxID=1500264 RepID=UPI00091E1544|nr:DUF1800 domain-containing protein [Rhizobacter sp. OV335]SHN02354.1 Uncharacterized conserved protein, DUF1800 family [Rhizobacter sp. OV335]
MKSLPPTSAFRKTSRLWAGALLISLLAACGGNKNDDDAAAIDTSTPPTKEEAARFLTQATYGPTAADIDQLAQIGYRRWLEQQMAKPQKLHRDYMTAAMNAAAAAGTNVTSSNFMESYWAQAITGDDQLRQRAAYVLSQIFVVSFVDSTLSNLPRGVAGYYDTLGQHAFGNYRDLLEAITMHPMMGAYLTSLRNQKEDAKTGRVPDENYAREIMQLFSIGLYQLNNDGTVKSGNPETYTHDDIAGLAKVFTGLSWYAGPNTADRTRNRFFGGDVNADRDWKPMQGYNKYASNTDFHSNTEKKFLGKTIAATDKPDVEGDIKVVLDTLFNHPNVGPFLGRQIIQRMVTSNPSPAYVERVAKVFNNNGSGVRGDLGAVFRAVLLDPEARTVDTSRNDFGKLREPVMRLAHLLRTFHATSTTGKFQGIDNTDDPANRLGQTAMRSPTVFNFYRPGYTPPNTSIEAADLVAPELQLANEVSVAGYLNYLRGWIAINTGRDVQIDFSAEQALAAKPDDLLDRLNLLMMSGQMPTTLRAQLLSAVNGRMIPPVRKDTAGKVINQTDIDAATRDRVAIAVFLTMASSDYLTQK